MMKGPPSVLLATLAALGLLLESCDGASNAGRPVLEIGQQLEITGEPVYYGWTGIAVGRLGDVNGDGHDDLLVSARGPSEGGRAAVFFGPLQAGTNLSIDDAGFVVQAGFDYVELANDVEHAGGCDVNGDGIRDILLGAPYSDRSVISATVDHSGDRAGRAVLFLGKKGLGGKVAPASADTIFIGEAPYGLAGVAVACLGDLDGDGKGDLAIGASKVTRNGVRESGAIYLFYGRNFGAQIDLLTDADAVFVGQKPFEQAGRTIAPVGDFDGDGHPDFVIASPNANNGVSASGGAYLIRGGGARFSGLISLSSAVSVSVPSDALRSGWRVEGLADFNGDGLNDFALGSYPAPLAKDATGRVLVYLGSKTPSSSLLSSFTIRGLSASDGIGVGLAGGRDLDGDDLPDLLVGGPDVGGQGAVYVVAGSRSPHDVQLAQPAGAPGDGTRWQAGGDEPGAWFGENVAFVGDANGDGRESDFLVSARGVTRGRMRAGAVMLFAPAAH